MSDVFEVKIVPERELFYNAESNYGIYACTPNDSTKVKLNTYGNISIKGNTVKLTIDNEYKAKLEEKTDKKFGVYYEIVSIFEDIPTDITKQRDYLSNLLTGNQVKALFNAYPNSNMIELIKNDQININKVKGIGKKTYKRIKEKIIENLEFQQAYEFLSKYGVTNNFIIKLVKHFKSATLLIQKMTNNPYCITEVIGIGFKKADTIALSMGYNPTDEFRMISAIEYIVEEEGNNGHTYITIDKLLIQAEELTGADMNEINQHIKDTDDIIVIKDKVALKKNYNAEKYISKRLRELNNTSIELNYNVENFIEVQENKLGITLTDQQKGLYHNIKQSRVNVLSGSAGSGKSKNVEILINLLEQLNISYKLLSPTGKAAKVLTNYTNRSAETIHRAIGLGLQENEGISRFVDEEFIIVDEASMIDVRLCAKLLQKCSNPKVRILFIGDQAQISAVGAGNVLHDIIQSKTIPLTQLDIIFRQKDGGALDIITKIRMNERFLQNDFWGIKKYGSNCIIACVPQEKVVGGYQYFLNEYLKTFISDDVTVTTPTKKGQLGTVEINKHIQDIVNPNDSIKKEKETGFDKVTFREGDLVLNTKNTYQIYDIEDRKVDIVNGDIGKVIKIDLEEEEILVDFEFTIIPFEFGKLNQLLHCWSMTTHKMQGSSNKAIIVIADKAHKFQLNANLLYTACSRTTDQLVIISQAETINYAMRKKANLQRNTFLGEMLLGVSK